MFTEQIQVQGAAGVSKITVNYTPVCMGVGRLVISQKRCSCEYGVREITTDTPGRAVRMTKSGPKTGSDFDCDSYDVFVGEDGEQMCDCRGFTQHGVCKHVAALDAIVGNGWINQSAAVEAEEEASEPDEPIQGFAKFMADVPVQKDRVWCDNYRECGGVDVPGYEMPTVSVHQLCDKCYAAAIAAKEAEKYPGYAEYLAEQDAKDEADPVTQAKRTAYDDVRSEEMERRLSEIEAVRTKIAKVEQDNFNRAEPDEVAVDRLVAKLNELEADLPSVPAPKKLSPPRPGSFFDLNPATKFI